MPRDGRPRRAAEGWGAAHRRGQVRIGAAAVEHLAKRGDAVVEPQRVEGLERAAARARISRETTLPLAHDVGELAQACLGIGQVARAEGYRGRCEGVVGERHRGRIAGTHAANRRCFRAWRSCAWRAPGTPAEKFGAVTWLWLRTRARQLERETAWCRSTRSSSARSAAVDGSARRDGRAKRGSRLVVMRVFMRSYGPAMRRTCARRRPGRACRARGRRRGPAAQEVVLHAEQVERLAGDEVDRVRERVRLRVERGHGGEDQRTRRRSLSSISRRMAKSGVCAARARAGDPP